MKKLKKNKLFKNYISFLIPLFIIECLFRVLLDMPLFDWAFVRIFFGCNILSLLVGIITIPLKERTGKIVSTIILLVATVYAIMQAGFENFIGVFVSLGTSSQLGAVKEYIKDYFDSFNPLFYTMAIPFALYVIYKNFVEKKIFGDYFKNLGNIFDRRVNKNSTWLAAMFIVVFAGIYYQSLTMKFMQNELQLESTKALFRNPSNPSISVNQFGISAFGILDVKTTIIKPEDDEIIDIKKRKETEVTDYSRHIDDTNWINLNNETTNSNYKLLNEYFMNREITEKNEYTGMFKGKNLIVIMLESVNEIFINPEYYPTFYKMYTEGWSFENSYSPRNSCSTGNNEMSGMVSLFSINRSCTANNYKNNKYEQSIFGVFNQAGYQTSSYHNYTEKYYYRSTIHKNMGSGAYYGVSDLNIAYDDAYKEWPSDVLLMEETMNRIDTNNPFMAWITTVTSHQPYYLSSEMGDKHLSLFEDKNYSTSLKRYMSKLKELDLALERLLQLLEERGVLEDTVIVMFGDHYPYGLDQNDINAALDYNVKENNNVDKTPFVIYNSEIEGKHFEQYTSYMNILPTVANLFDLDYDPRYYAGEDILSPKYINSYKNRVVLADGSWENSIAKYNATNGKITYFTDQTYSNEDIIEYNKEINNMIKMSNLAIKTNYFNYLCEGLNKFNEVVETTETEINTNN